MSLDKLMAKKKKEQGEMTPEYKQAKMNMLQALRGEMGKMMGDDLKNGTMKKVEVAAPDKEGLAEGLAKAKDLLANKDMGDDSDDSDAEDMEDEGKDEASEGEEDHSPMNAESAEKMIADMIGHETEEGELDDDQIDQLIQLLEKKKAAKMMK